MKCSAKLCKVIMITPETLPFLIVNGGIGLAVVWLMNSVFGYMKDRDKNQTATEQTQTETYKGIISSFAESNAQLRSSSERREAEYQAHNERMATALSRVNETQVSQVSVLEEIHKSNQQLVVEIRTSQANLDTKIDTIKQGTLGIASDITIGKSRLDGMSGVLDSLFEEFKRMVEAFPQMVYDHEAKAKQRHIDQMTAHREYSDLGKNMVEKLEGLQQAVKAALEKVQTKELPAVIAAEKDDQEVEHVQE